MVDNHQPLGWPYLFRVVVKAGLLFCLCNVVFAVTMPLEGLGRLSLYNGLVPGRQRLPYGEDINAAYNLSLENIPAMLHSHEVVQTKSEDEYRVLLLGDSGTWGWFLTNEESVAGQLNAANLLTADNRRVRVYNLGYPLMSLGKDLLLLDAALAYEPDLVVWLVTLQSFPRGQQLQAPLVQANPDRWRRLIAEYHLDLEPYHPDFVEPQGWERTIVGQRRPLANWLRLQLVGFAWGATGIDQVIPAEIPLRRTDLEADESWQTFPMPTRLTEADLALDVLMAGVARAAPVPVLLVNEPMFVSEGLNGDVRYNSFYPRWAYDEYRRLLGETAVEQKWHYLDWWDTITPTAFSDSPVHLTPMGAAQLAERLGLEIVYLADKQYVVE